MKDPLDGLKNRLNTAKEKISKLTDIETIQNETEKKYGQKQ